MVDIKDLEEAAKHAGSLSTDRTAELLFGAAEMIAELQDFAIWLTSCGYDFTQHDYFIKQRDKLLKGKYGGIVEDFSEWCEPPPNDYQRGYQDGHTKGYNKGQPEGYKKGKKDLQPDTFGRAKAYNQGFKEGQDLTRGRITEFLDRLLKGK